MDKIRYDLTSFIKSKTGEKYSFERLKESIRQSDEPESMIRMYLSAFIGGEPPKTNQWNVLEQKFRREYPQEIAGINGFILQRDPSLVTVRPRPLVVEGDDEFFDFFAGGYRRGIFRPHSLHYFSCWMYEHMELNMKQRSIYNKLERFR